MKEEGRRREAAYKNGEYVDVVEFGLLKSEFIAQSK
jgi:RimJ/RimL family protein N-acetyltransferase